MSRRAAAKRCGVSSATSIKLVDQVERTGDLDPRPQGGDHRSHHLEAHAAETLGLIEAQRDITLAEIVGHLEREHGVKVAQSTVWRLLRSEEHTSELQSLMRISYAVFCLKKKNKRHNRQSA